MSERWWYEPPIPARVHDAIERIDRRLAKLCAQVDAMSVCAVAQMIDDGYLHEGWPWELTKRGKAFYSGSRRTSRR